MKLAEALVLRKHLEMKVKQLEPLKLQGDKGLFEVQTTRHTISENVEEVKTQLPKVTLHEVSAEYDKYSKALRQLDVKIQEANWKTAITFDDSKLSI